MISVVSKTKLTAIFHFFGHLQAQYRFSTIFIILSLGVSWTFIIKKIEKKIYMNLLRDIIWGCIYIVSNPYYVFYKKNKKTKKIVI
jgi:hypothetical protein